MSSTSKAEPGGRQLPKIRYKDDHGSRGKVLFIHEFLPRFPVAGSDTRLLHNIHGLRSLGYSVYALGSTPHTFGGVQPGAVEAALDALGVRYAGNVSADSAEFAALMRHESFDVVFMMMWFWGRLDAVPQRYTPAIQKLQLHRCPVLAIVTDDVHYVRESTLARLAGGTQLSQRAAALERAEGEALQLADVVFAISDKDRERILTRWPSLDVHLLGLFHPVPASSLRSRAHSRFSARSGLLFVGGADNPTNIYSLYWLVHDILPQVRKAVPSVILHVAGFGWKVSGFEVHNGVHVLGVVSESQLHGLLNSSLVFVSPVLAGTGVVTRNLRAFASGIPVVTTTLGIHGYRLSQTGQDHRGAQVAMVADTASSFAQSVITLYTSSDLWTQVSNTALAHASEYFTQEPMLEELNSVMHTVEGLCNRPSLVAFNPPPTPALPTSLSTAPSSKPAS